MKSRRSFFLALALLLAVTSPVFAYIGPGLGAGALTSIFGGIIGVGMLILGTILHPLRLAITKVKKTLKISE